MANKDIEFPELELPTAQADTQQDNRVLPRDIFTGGTLPGNTVIRIGASNLIIDGANGRITMNDGSVDRVIIGKHIGGF